jgi:hypothetical protein
MSIFIKGTKSIIQQTHECTHYNISALFVAYRSVCSAVLQFLVEKWRNSCRLTSREGLVTCRARIVHLKSDVLGFR